MNKSKPSFIRSFNRLLIATCLSLYLSAHAQLPIGRSAAPALQNGEVAAQNPAAQTLAGVKTVVFISSSMPEANLMALLKPGSNRRDVAFMLNGFKGNAEQTADWIAAIRAKLGPDLVPAIALLPQAFDAYKVTKVPVIIHKNPDGRWYRRDGAIGLDDTLRLIEAGDPRLVIGRQWSIAEIDPRPAMKKAIETFDYPGWKKAEEKKLRARLERGHPLPAAQVAGVRTFDPTMTLDWDIRDSLGRVNIPKGTRLNPLANDPSGNRGVIVIDGREPWQIALALREKKTKPWLTLMYTHRGGLEMRSTQSLPLDPLVAQRFGFTAVPQMSRQKGPLLEVTTFTRSLS